MGKLLILDLDETLIHASAEPLARVADFSLGKYQIYRRPGVSEFIQQMNVHYELAVWTSSSPAYAHGVVRQLFNDIDALAFIWASDRCTRRFDAEFYRHISSKNLSKLKRRGYRLEQVLMVDDSPEKLSRHYGNLVQVSPYGGAEDDRELALLGRYLTRIADHANVRQLEKRGWRQRVLSDWDLAANPTGNDH